MAKALAKGSRITGPQRDALASQYAKRYAAGDSIRKIADEGGRSFGFVHGVLKEAKVALRGRGGATRGARAGHARGEEDGRPDRRQDARQEDADEEVDDESRDQGEQQDGRGDEGHRATKATTKKTGQEDPGQIVREVGAGQGGEVSAPSRATQSAAKKATRQSAGPAKKSSTRGAGEEGLGQEDFGQESRRQEGHGQEELTRPERRPAPDADEERPGSPVVALG